MKVFDEKYRLFGIANPIDIVVVTVALAVVVIAALSFLQAGPVQITTTTERIDAAILCRDVPMNVVINLTEGDPVSKKGVGGPIGEVVSWEVAPADRELIGPDGDLHAIKSGIWWDVTVYVEGDGNISDKGAFMGDGEIRVNEVFDLQTGKFESAGARVLDIGLAEGSE